MNRKALARDITVATAAFGVTTVVSSFITSTMTSNMKLPAKAAVMAGALIAGVVVMDASRSGVKAQFDEILAKFTSMTEH